MNRSPQRHRLRPEDLCVYRTGQDVFVGFYISTGLPSHTLTRFCGRHTAHIKAVPLRDHQTEETDLLFLVPADEGWPEVLGRQTDCLHMLQTLGLFRKGRMVKESRVTSRPPALLGHLSLTAGPRPSLPLSKHPPTPGMVIITDVIIIGTQQDSVPRMFDLGTTLPSEMEMTQLLGGCAVQEVALHSPCRPGRVGEGDRKGTEAFGGQ